MMVRSDALIQVLVLTKLYRFGPEQRGAITTKPLSATELTSRLIRVCETGTSVGVGTGSGRRFWRH